MLHKEMSYRITCPLPLVVNVYILGRSRAIPSGVPPNLVCAVIQLSLKELPGKQTAATLNMYKAHFQTYQSFLSAFMANKANNVEKQC